MSVDSHNDFRFTIRYSDILDTSSIATADMPLCKALDPLFPHLVDSSGSVAALGTLVFDCV